MRTQRNYSVYYKQKIKLEESFFFKFMRYRKMLQSKYCDTGEDSHPNKQNRKK